MCVPSVREIEQNALGDTIFNDTITHPLPADTPFLIRAQIHSRLQQKRRFPLDRITSVPLQIIASHLSLPDILHLAQAVPEFRSDLAEIPSIRVRAALLSYFPDVPNFVKALNQCGGIVGGFTVLSVLQPGAWKARDLDIIAPSVAFPLLDQFLLAEGRTIESDRDHNYADGAEMTF